MATQQDQPNKVWDKVTFDNNQIEIFKDATHKNDKAVKQFQQLILIGRGKVDCVKDLAENLTTVCYYDGWEEPVQTKYPISLPARIKGLNILLC